MPHRAILTPEDDLFGRVALFNNLVTLDQIVECARIISAELVVGRPQRPLATMLILKGYLTPQAAGAVEAALRRRLAAGAAEGQAPPAPDAPSPKPPPLQERAPAGTSQITVALTGEEEYVPATGPADEQLRKVVARIAPGRIYPEMLNYLVRHQIAVVEVKKLAAAIGEPEKAVLAALHFWRGAGLLKPVATCPYGFSPSDRDEADIALFLEAWNDPRRHAKVLGFILEAEH